MRDFVGRHFRHFNAGELRRCSESLCDFVDDGGRLMITLAGAMSTAEIGRSLAPAIRRFVARVQIWKRICSILSQPHTMVMFRIGETYLHMKNLN